MQKTIDPLERIAQIRDAEAELAAELSVALFDARLQGRERFFAAVELSGLSVKQAKLLTRRENERRGRQIRWGDGL